VVRDAATILHPVADAQHKTISLDIPDHPVIVRGSHDALRRVLVNVVINGLEAMAPNRNIDLALHTENRRSIVRVQDQGAGIAPELLDVVCEMGTSTKPGGSGIGLFVSRVVMAEHGGHIRLSSDPGVGTTVELVLPLAPDGDACRRRCR
jgi:signal transduction histidine kinase